jgi:type II secretory pathway component PulF
MAQRLKRWESPRNEGRNDKGRGGGARQRQKQMRMLKQKLKQQDNSTDSQTSAKGGKKKRREANLFLSSFLFLLSKGAIVSSGDVHNLHFETPINKAL